MLLEWHNTAAYISSCIGTGQFALSLVCDFDSQHQDSLEAARRVIGTLALFPPLKDCHIRLASDPNHTLQQLAEEGVLQARPSASLLRIGPAKASSPLTSLPAELRLRILEYTDLITPWGEVTWGRDPRFRGYQVVRPPCTLAREHRCPPHILRGCRMSRCRCYRCYPDSSREYGCFCRRRHAAFSLDAAVRPGWVNEPTEKPEKRCRMNSVLRTRPHIKWSVSVGGAKTETGSR
jgi:hypothetical protein